MGQHTGLAPCWSQFFGYQCSKRGGSLLTSTHCWLEIQMREGMWKFFASPALLSASGRPFPISCIVTLVLTVAFRTQPPGHFPRSPPSVVTECRVDSPYCGPVASWAIILFEILHYFVFKLLIFLLEIASEFFPSDLDIPPLSTFFRFYSAYLWCNNVISHCFNKERLNIRNSSGPSSAQKINNDLCACACAHTLTRVWACVPYKEQENDCGGSIV